MRAVHVMHATSRCQSKDPGHLKSTAWKPTRNTSICVKMNFPVELRFVMPPRPRWRAGVLRGQASSITACWQNLSHMSLLYLNNRGIASLQDFDEGDRRYLDEMMREHEEFGLAMRRFCLALAQLLRAANAVRNAGARHFDVFYTLHLFLRHVISIFNQ